MSTLKIRGKNQSIVLSITPNLLGNMVQRDINGVLAATCKLRDIGKSCDFQSCSSLEFDQQHPGMHHLFDNVAPGGFAN